MSDTSGETAQRGQPNVKIGATHIELIGRALLVEFGHVDTGADPGQSVVGGIVC